MYLSDYAEVVRDTGAARAHVKVLLYENPNGKTLYDGPADGMLDELSPEWLIVEMLVDHDDMKDNKRIPDYNRGKILKVI